VRCFLAAAFVVVTAGPALFAQSASVSQISGTVQDSSGAADPAVQHSSLNGSTGGNFFFTGAVKDLSMADFVIGAVSSFTQTNPQNVYEKHEYSGLYLQDSWKLNPRLAFNYGIRWEACIGGSIPKGRVTHFEPADHAIRDQVFVLKHTPIAGGRAPFAGGHRPESPHW
jgi:outer membrane receptor protein involved in Fe transport